MTTMQPTKAKSIYLIFLLLIILALYFLFERMIWNGKDYFNARYSDREFVELMDGLINEKVFQIKNGKIVADQDALKRTVQSDRTMARVRESLPFLYVKGQKIYFDRFSVSVVNSRTLEDESVLRGRFLDRNGDVLAKSTFNEKTWRQSREYAYGPEFYQVIGHWSRVFGKRNLEKELNSYLTGEAHWPVYRKTSEPFRKLKLGDDVILTLDSQVQRSAYALMQGKRGAVVVLDIKTGEILAAVSTPSFDPNTRERDGWREAFMDETEKPYLNRAIAGLYPPGSTFKTVVAATWLEADDEIVEVLKNGVECKGRRNQYQISDNHVHGKIDLERAFAESCNVFFSEAGVLLGPGVLEYAERFGFGRKFDLVPQLKKVRYETEPSLAFSWYEYKEDGQTIRSYGERDYRRNPKIVAQCAIGQNLVTATPLQMALIASTVANRGVLLNPYMVKEIRTGDGEKAVFSARPVKMERVMKRKTANKLREFMVDVMEIGTGKNVKKIYLDEGRFTTARNSENRKEIKIAGKTGTAQVGDRNGNGETDPDDRPHSWFIGFAPADDPKVAVAVIAENQGYGSLTAAPIGVEVMAAALGCLAEKQGVNDN